MFLRVLTCVLGLYASLCYQVFAAEPIRLGLEGRWTLTQDERRISIPASVPGIVQLDLMKAGKIPDPFFRDNEKAVQWVGECAWRYTRSFSVPAAFAHQAHVVLRCEGLDTLAKVLLNGREVGRPDNMFRTWEFDVRPYLHAGPNQIEIDFEPIEPFLKAHETQALFPGKPVQSHGWGYVRKPPFEQGWDFSPKLITAGIWRGIGLVGWNAARLTDIQTTQDHTVRGQVGLNVKVAADTSIAPVTAHIAAWFDGKMVSTANVPLRAGIGDANLTIRRPHLWWPVDMGAQNLYRIEVQLRNARGRLLDRGSKRIGLRTVSWIAKSSSTPLTMVVNGRKVFAKGSNWVPRDSLLARIRPAQEMEMVGHAVAAHMNLMRLWGGGFYENDGFFNACDEKGLLVWFEFKFADATYPAFDPQWLANVQAEASDNIQRVRHHPCIAIFSGNNEVVGFIGDKTEAGRMSRDDYNLLFHTTLADLVHKLSPNTAYTPGSPEVGDEHDWDVWHGNATFASYRKVHGFMSEYGFQGFPVPESIDMFTKLADRASVLSPIMEFHQRNWRDGNQLIQRALIRNYRKPKDFDSTLWLSQIQQAAGVLTGVEHWRRDWPRSSGSLVWQFDDPWPAISWSMIDYYGRPKALYYRLRQAYAPVALSGVVDGETGRVALWVANDRLSAKQGRADWELTRMDGSVVRKGTVQVSIPPGTSSVCAATLDESQSLKRYGQAELLVSARLQVAGEPDSRTTLLFSKPKDLDLQNPRLTGTVKASHGGYVVSLTSAKPALWAWIDLPGIDAELSDNFVCLRPGERVEIVVKPKAKTTIGAIRKALRVSSLYDTYLPGVEVTTTIAPRTDGRIVASAEDAEILGDAAILESGAPSNIGSWTNPSDSLRWVVEGAKAGFYRVSAIVAVPINEEGSQFEVNVAGAKVEGTVPGTKSWWDYREMELGKVEISKSGSVEIDLKPTKMVGEHVMNLREVELTPIRS